MINPEEHFKKAHESGLITDIEYANHLSMTKETKERFEQIYGKNTSIRNATQWKALVKTYGMQTVMSTEKMTEAQIKARIKETFTQRFNRQLREKRNA